MSAPTPLELHTSVVGDGPVPVVFLHGLFGQGKNFTQVAKAIGDLATSTLVDMPNHGRSGWTQEHTYPGQAAHVAALLQSLGSGPVCLVGHSMGGKVAMRVALEHPELVERLMVVDISPAVGLGTDFRPYIRAMQGLDLTTLPGRREADAALRPAIPDDVVRGFLMQNLRHDPGADGSRRWHWQMNLDVLGRELEHGIADWPAIEASYPGPVLWVAGEHSHYVTPEAAPTMRELFPKYVQVTIKGAGHWVHSEQPAAFVSTLRHFLGARRSAPGA